MRSTAVAGIGVWLAALLLVTPLVRAQAAPKPAGQVRQWIAALDSDNFAEREAATEALSGAGSTAIDALAKLDLPAQNLEVLSRGIHVLQQLALADDVTVEENARALLEQLAESKNVTASRRAATTLSSLNGMRQDRTIAQLKELKVRVSVNTTQVGLALVQEVPTIEIDETFTGKPDDLKRLKYLEDIRLVQLAGPKITDEVLARVAQMKHLQYLKIKWAKVTNDGLKPFVELPELQHVSVLYSPIDDEAIETLGQLKTLNNVRLYGTSVTKPAAQRLETMLGGAGGIDGIRKVDHRHGAFLGIGGDRHTRGCEVTLVQPNSVAQKAGILPGDIVVRFAGEPVADFEALTMAIGKYKARDAVTFEILRDGESKKIDVTLGEWDW
jgi:hypothetical protein